MIIYIDTSALGCVYLGDQSDSTELTRVVYEGDRPVITSELTDVEIASKLARASRDGVIDSVTASGLLDRYAADTSDTGPLGVVALDSDTIALAQRYVLSTPLRTLDAIHLAACARFGESTPDEVRLLSRDNRQNEAAYALGIALAED
ncbi:type II toxin-antitoxin system VapC family toxin [Jatrophihabitans lederbergiae]|uniref:Type II toxin-antitoxin system VapC family toxin n=1 Tax=Jatrophihabitans lederbergiae TaxID=3075547 RepID=A0ABU2JCI7_9ACTN|nr:type II toxin-antitoxin system VapC family toxin [Jatrophihabitans sp. DSM 44399]MDT0262189.1 type II toxin-antitoxin system VapC family toxin [Jatrophihabitans sp. DSM 44399]